MLLVLTRGDTFVQSAVSIFYQLNGSKAILSIYKKDVTGYGLRSTEPCIIIIPY